MICSKWYLDAKEMRAYYCDALMYAAELNEKIVAVDADVSFSMGTEPFTEKFPQRSINCGIMEAHAVGFAAGMSAVGYVPFVHMFGTFATRRAFDQLFLSCAYQDLNVKIIGGDAGVTATANGGTHMPFEDMAIVRTIPNFTIVEPADGTMYKYLVPHMANTYGNFYVRSSRKKAMKIYQDDAKFTLGHANILTKGNDVAIISCGIMVHQALLAYELLKKDGIEASVVDMHTIKPIDRSAVENLANLCGAIVTAENHNIIGGLGNAVGEYLLEIDPVVPMERVGVNDTFGEVGTQEFLMAKFGLTAEKIARKAKKVIGRKRK